MTFSKKIVRWKPHEHQFETFIVVLEDGVNVEYTHIHTQFLWFYFPAKLSTEFLFCAILHV